MAGRRSAPSEHRARFQTPRGRQTDHQAGSRNAVAIGSRTRRGRTAAGARLVLRYRDGAARPHPPSATPPTSASGSSGQGNRESYSCSCSSKEKDQGRIHCLLHRRGQRRTPGMAKMKVWFDEEGDFLEMMFADRKGSFREIGSRRSTNALTHGARLSVLQSSTSSSAIGRRSKFRWR